MQLEITTGSSLVKICVAIPATAPGPTAVTPVVSVRANPALQLQSENVAYPAPPAMPPEIVQALVEPPVFICPVLVQPENSAGDSASPTATPAIPPT